MHKLDIKITWGSLNIRLLKYLLIKGIEKYPKKISTKCIPYQPRDQTSFMLLEPIL